MSPTDVSEKEMRQLEAEATSLANCKVADCKRGTPLHHLTYVRRAYRNRAEAKKSKAAAAAKLDGLR